MRDPRPASRRPRLAAGDEPGGIADAPVPATAPAPAPEVRLRAVPSGGYADWDTVYRDNIGRVYQLMFARVGNRPDAEDLTTEVFLAALRPLRLPASQGEVRAYLLATSRTVLARYWARTLGRGRPRLVCPCHGATFALDGAVLTHRLSITLAALPLIDVREAAGVVQVYALAATQVPGPAKPAASAGPAPVPSRGQVSGSP